MRCFRMQQQAKQGKGHIPSPNSFSRDRWHGEAQKKKEVGRLRKIKACSLGAHEILGGVFETLPRWRLLGHVFWFDKGWFSEKASEGWYWDLCLPNNPRTFHFEGKQTSWKQARWEEGEKIRIPVLWVDFNLATTHFVVNILSNLARKRVVNALLSG